jgi:hypothetical protein
MGSSIIEGSSGVESAIRLRPANQAQHHFETRSETQNDERKIMRQETVSPCCSGFPPSNTS